MHRDTDDIFRYLLQLIESHLHLSIWAFFTGFNGKIKNIVIIWMCLLAHKHRFFSFGNNYQHSKHHTCSCAPIYINPWHINDKLKPEKKTLRPIPNLRQLAINPHSINWTNYSPPVMNTESIQLTQSLCIAAVVFCTAILMCHHRAAFHRSARLPGMLS